MHQLCLNAAVVILCLAPTPAAQGQPTPHELGLQTDPGAADPFKGISKWIKVLHDKGVDFQTLLRDPFGVQGNHDPFAEHCGRAIIYDKSMICRFQSMYPSCQIKQIRTSTDMGFAAEIYRYSGISHISSRYHSYRPPFKDPIPEMIQECKNPSNADKPSCQVIMLVEFREKILKQIVNFGKAKRLQMSKYVTQAWYRHPKLKPVCRTRPDELVKYVTELSKIKTLKDKIVPLLDTNVWPVNITAPFRAELDAVCKTNPNDKFCMYKKVFLLSEPIREVKKIADKYTWESEVAQAAMAALSMQFKDFKKNSPTEFKDIPPLSEKALYVENTRHIFAVIQENNFVGLNALMSLYSKFEAAYFGEKSVSGTTEQVLLYNLHKLVEQARLIVDRHQQALNTRKVLTTEVDLKVLLLSSEMNKILDFVKGQKSDLLNIANYLTAKVGQSVASQFEGLKTYFTKVESFNRDKSMADIKYVKGMLDTFTKSSKKLQGTVNDNIDKIVKYALQTAQAQVGEQAAMLALRIAEACNPMDWLLNGGSASEIMETASLLANSIADLAVVQKLKSSVSSLIKETKALSVGFAKNNDFLKVIRRVIDNIDSPYSSFEADKTFFLSKYADYQPGITRPQLVGVEVFWGVVVDEACTIIENSQASASAHFKRMVGKSGICWKTKIEIAKMIETFSEIYDFQFDLVADMASYMRAQTAVNAAQSMNANFDAITSKAGAAEDKLMVMEQMSAIMVVTHKVQTWVIVDQYCNILEYKNGGRRPAVCKGVKSDVPALLAHPEAACDNEVRLYVNIPTVPSNSSDKAYVNITDLYAGNEITFKIENQQWLRDNGWIGVNDRIIASYVKDFEVYAPTKTTTYRRVKSSVIGLLNNELIPGQTEYVIVPQHPMVFEYQEGLLLHNCRKGKLQNPYTTCTNDKISYICPLSNDLTTCEELKTKTLLFPSIFSTWKIQLHGFKFSPVPDPATELPIKVGILMCTMYNRTAERQITRRDVRDTPSQHSLSVRSGDRAGCDKSCCPANQYLSQKTFTCKPCPAGSVSALGGYYCQKAPTE
ncbi:uncharacterized protein [Haliotis cracherodii]|uniref:uncharacterized protein n=1 Tax=Haliotis cracherodii TaxID=6455 RepID=UPI0039E94FC5